MPKSLCGGKIELAWMVVSKDNKVKDGSGAQSSRICTHKTTKAKVPNVKIVVDKGNGNTGQVCSVSQPRDQERSSCVMVRGG